MNITPSLELCIQMKELGYKQKDSVFIYFRDADSPKYAEWDIALLKTTYVNVFEWVAAPTVGEMVEWLKVNSENAINKGVYCGFNIQRQQYYCSLLNMDTETVTSLSNAVAMAVIWVLEQKG